MNKIDVYIEPIWEDSHVGSVHIEIHGIQNAFCFHEKVFDKQFCALTNPVEWMNGENRVIYNTHLEYESAREIRWYTPVETIGEDSVIKYTVKLQPVGKNPVFDLGYEDGGMTGTGFTFLPGLEKGQYEYEVFWNLQQMPGSFHR